MQFSFKQIDVFILTVPCAPGMYMVSSQCFPCPEGHYQPLPGQLTCEPCTGNRTVVEVGTNCTGKNKLQNSNVCLKKKSCKAMPYISSHGCSQILQIYNHAFVFIRNS